MRGLTTACKVVGGLTYSVDIFLYLWNACLVRRRLSTLSGAVGRTIYPDRLDHTLLGFAIRHHSFHPFPFIQNATQQQAYSMYSWIVRKALLRHLYERMKTLCVVALVISLFVSLVPALMGDFGALPTVTCWLTTLDVTNPSVIINKASHIHPPTGPHCTNQLARMADID